MGWSGSANASAESLNTSLCMIKKAHLRGLLIYYFRFLETKSQFTKFQNAAR